MKTPSSPAPSRASSLSSLSKTTALDSLHGASDLHHIHHHLHQNSDATQVGSIKAPNKMDKVASFDQANDGDPEKGRQDQCCSQLPEDTSQDDLGRTCSWNDLPQWMRDNPAIVTGYRRATNSYRKCMRSLLYLHNETGE